MDYNKQIEEIANYFKNNEKQKTEFKIGVEFEHFVIDKESLKTISYYGKDGVEESLKDLVEKGWEPTYEGEYLLGLKKDNKTITLEPGSQLELSIKATRSIKEIESAYLDFLDEITPILKSKGQGLIATGYHPATKIDEITLLPKQRYDYMFNYFKTRGSHAHNMMKGTSALQVSLDYGSEEDYIQKFRIMNALSPVLFAIFDNSYYFENEVYKKHNLRAHIWENCDSDRSGLVEGALEDDFNYKRYAEYILNRPAIFISKDGKETYTGGKKVKELFDPEDYTIEYLEHLLTMFFPDVRTKRYIEIRMMDSVPYPLNIAVVALLTGLLYNENNLEELYEYVKNITIEDVNKSKSEMKEIGMEAKLKDNKILEIGKYLVELATKGLSEEERKYLLPLEGMLLEGKNPYEITKEKAEKGKKNALGWCLLNDYFEVK